jgi:hypothetical protein
MPTWPTTGSFPQTPRVGTWTRTAADTVAEFAPEIGPARIRRVVTTAQYNCSGSFLLTETQVDTIMDFWADDCDLGSLSFTWRDPEDPGTTRTWEWAEVPQVTHLTNDVYVVTVSLIRQS